MFAGRKFASMDWLWEGILNSGSNFNIQVDLTNKRKIFKTIKFLKNFNEYQIASTKIQQFRDLSESFELIKNIMKQVCFGDSKTNDAI